MAELMVTSPAFEHEGLIPVEHTGHGADMSPEIILSNIDSQAVSIAIIMDDMGALMPAYNHWIIWNIPVTNTIPKSIPHGETVEVLSGAIQGRGYGKNRYRGPKPPFNQSHKYHFNVYVLDSALNLSSSSKKRDLVQAMHGHIIQQATLIGHYR